MQCPICEQQLTRKMSHRHMWDECDRYKAYINEVGLKGFSPFKESALGKIKEYGIPFSKHSIQRQRGSGLIDIYITEKTAAFMCNIWKARCLGYLLKEYTTDLGFRQCIESMVEVDASAAIDFCEDAWLSDNMRVDDKKVKAAIIKFVQMTERSFNAMKDESRSLDYGEHKGAYVLYGKEIEEVRDAMFTLRKSIRGKCRRDKWTIVRAR